LSNEHPRNRLQKDFNGARERRFAEVDVWGAILVIETHVT
jgi:hypothetical protein